MPRANNEENRPVTGPEHRMFSVSFTSDGEPKQRAFVEQFDAVKLIAVAEDLGVLKAESLTAPNGYVTGLARSRRPGMPDNATGDPTVLCDGAPRDCELLACLDGCHTQLCEEAGIAGPGAVVNAMAVGLVIDVWRNGPVEAMHSSRRGPDDAAMFAESTALHDEAVKALTAKNREFGLSDFERHLLDRARPWAGTGGRTLKDLGYGFLGDYARHVKDRTDALASLGDHTCVADPLQVYLVSKALMFGGRNHKGMPGWRLIVERIGILLADPAHPAWREDGRGAQALAEMPQQALPIEQLAATLLTTPSTLPVEVLEWLSHHLLFCAAPPYSAFSWKTRDQ